MRSWVGQEVGRVIVINLERGEKLLESISASLKRQGIKDAILLGCIGSLQTAVFHVVACTDEHPVDKFVTLADKPIELSSVQGVVLNGQPHFPYSYV